MRAEPSVEKFRSRRGHLPDRPKVGPPCGHVWGCSCGVIAFRQVGASSVCLVTLAALVGSTGVASADCKPAAIAQGDPALVRGLVVRLAASGIATTTTAGCPAVQVDLEQRGTQVHVRLADASQRTGERDVEDVATAAALVESWTYQEIDAGSLPAAPVLMEVPHTARSGIAASAMSGLGTNGGTTWIGGSLAACVRLGPVCAGAALRAQLDTTATGQTSTLAQDSYAITALATLDLPRRLGGYRVVPGIGIGYGYLHATTHHRDAMNNPLDVPSADHELRAGAHVALLRPWGDHFAAFVDLWTDLAALRSDSSFGPMGALSLSLGLRLQ